jgi:hypothetical protein
VKKWIYVSVAAAIAFTALTLGCLRADAIAKQTSIARQNLIDQRSLQQEIIDEQKYLITLQNDVKNYQSQLSAIQAQNAESREILRGWASQASDAAPPPEADPTQDGDTYVVNIPPSPELPADGPMVDGGAQGGTYAIYGSYGVWGGGVPCYRNCDRRPGAGGWNQTGNLPVPVNAASADSRPTPPQQSGRAVAGMSVPPAGPPPSSRPAPPPTQVVHNAPRAVGERFEAHPAPAPSSFGRRGGYYR